MEGPEKKRRKLASSDQGDGDCQSRSLSIRMALKTVITGPDDLAKIEKRIRILDTLSKTAWSNLNIWLTKSCHDETVVFPDFTTPSSRTFFDRLLKVPFTLNPHPSVEPAVVIWRSCNIPCPALTKIKDSISSASISMRVAFEGHISTNLWPRVYKFFVTKQYPESTSKHLANYCLGFEEASSDDFIYIDVDVQTIINILRPCWAHANHITSVDERVTDDCETLVDEIDELATEIQEDVEYIGAGGENAIGTDILMQDDDGDTDYIQDDEPRDNFDGLSCASITNSELEDLEVVENVRRNHVDVSGYDDPGDVEYIPRYPLYEKFIKSRRDLWVHVVKVLDYINTRFEDIEGSLRNYQALCPQPRWESVSNFRFDKYCLKEIGVWKNSWEETAPVLYTTKYSRGGKRSFGVKGAASIVTDGVSASVTFILEGDPPTSLVGIDPKHLVDPHLKKLVTNETDILPVWSIDPGDSDVFTASLLDVDGTVLKQDQLKGGFWRRKTGQIAAQQQKQPSGLEWRSTKSTSSNELLDAYRTNLELIWDNDYRFSSFGRRTNFRSSRRMQKCLSWISKRLKHLAMEVGVTDFIIAFGDYNRGPSCPIKGSARTPIRTIFRQLRRDYGHRACYASEYKSSKTCSECGDEKLFHQINPKPKCFGNPCRRCERIIPSSMTHRERQHWYKSEPCPILSIKPSIIWKSLHCRSSNCGASWDRDVNASRNIGRWFLSRWRAGISSHSTHNPIA